MAADATSGETRIVLSRSEIAARMLGEIEDSLQAGSTLDALGGLQDLTRDFAPELDRDAVALRNRYEAWRRKSREGSARSQEINDIRIALLDLAYSAEQIARGPSATTKPAVNAPWDAPAAATRGAAATSVGLAAMPEQAAPIADQRALVPAPPRSHHTVPGTLDEARKQSFGVVWADPSSIVASVQGVSKSFRSSAFSLDPVSFDLRIGEITGIVGRNASGKTTLLRILMGELKPDAGKVDYPRLTHRKNDWESIKRQIAFVPQLPDKWHGTLRHNLNFVAAMHASKGQDVKGIIDWCVARYELHRYEHATWDEISGGYKIRFELVRALVSQPKLLILDEPLAYLDVIARQRFLKDLLTIASSAANPIPIVVTSQHLNEIEAVADKMILLDNGVLKYSGSLEGIAEMSRFRVIEVSVAATREEATMALDGVGLISIEPAMDGYILYFPKTIDPSQVFTRLRAAFGDRCSAIRDITGSARSLMTEAAQ